MYIVYRYTYVYIYIYIYIYTNMYVYIYIYVFIGEGAFAKTGSLAREFKKEHYERAPNPETVSFRK